jgi:plastocyanin
MRAAATLLAVAALAGCSKKAEPPKGESATATPGTGTATPVPAVPTGPTVTLSGSIHFEGAPPERKPIKMSADEACKKQHTAAVLSEDVIAGSSGGLKNVFVAVKSGLEGKPFAVPAGAVVLDQKGCMYSPHVWGVVANQTVRIRNSDPTLHNVHGIPASGNDEFNVGMPRQDMEITRVFKEAGVVRFKCDVHPWMLSFGHVMTHPFFAVSDDNGAYAIENLPPGQYVVEAWQEKLGAQTATITVGEGGATTQTLDFTFKPAGS